MRTIKQRILNGVRFCKCCGARMFFQGYDTDQRYGYIMDQEQICFECAYWKQIIDYPPEHYEIVGDRCLKIMPYVEKPDKSMWLGGKGRQHFFMRKDLTAFMSNDVWNIGTVPERFREQLPSTLTEINRQIYVRLQRNSRKCEARACLDRYNCVRYKIEIEDGVEPYNKIPPTWKAGGEHCQAFINKNKIAVDKKQRKRKSLNNGKKNQRTTPTSSGSIGE